MLSRRNCAQYYPSGELSFVYSTRNCQSWLMGCIASRMRSRLAKWRCFVGASKVTETQKNGQTESATFPLSLHRAERSRTIDKTPPPSGGWAPRDDNIPLLIAIIPLCYGALRDSMQRESCRFARCISSCDRKDSAVRRKFTINLHAHVLTNVLACLLWTCPGLEFHLEHVLNISRILLRARVWS